jgi:hypothetical protein
VPGLHLPVRFLKLGQHSFLIGYIRLDRIRDKKIRTAAGSLRQPLLDLWFRRILRVALRVFAMSTFYHADLAITAKGGWDRNRNSLQHCHRNFAICALQVGTAATP